MSENRKAVFISCGQYAAEERELGKRVCELVKECTQFEGYFAENQTTLKALSENVLRRLYDSVGLIVIMHHRGRIEGQPIIRASVWVEQEVAIATLMEQVLRRPLHVALFVQRGIAIEGIRQHIQLNPSQFTDSEEVLERLREVLPGWKEPLYLGDDERRKLVDSVELSITTVHAHHHNYTIRLENHSQCEVEIKRISLWSKGQRISKPAHAPANVGWLARAGSEVSINFDTQEDVAHRLWQLAGSPPANFIATYAHLPGQLDAEVRVCVRCQVLGMEKEFEDTRTVRVDNVNHEINGL